jgi:hypothetical protein
MITQYDAVAEIEAMKLKRTSPVRRTSSPAPARPAWTGSDEAAIRAEMERRFQRRAARRQTLTTEAAQQ